MRCFPAISVEEAERLFDYLHLTLDANTFGLGDEAERKTWEILNTIFHYAEDCPKEQRKELASYPDWVQSFYRRASACEVQA